MIVTPATVNDVFQRQGLLHGGEGLVFADACCQGADKRSEATGLHWHIALRPCNRRALDMQSSRGALLEQAARIKSSVCGKVGHTFQMINRLFGFDKVRNRGLAKNTAQLLTLFAWCNLWMARNSFAHRTAG